MTKKKKVLDLDEVLEAGAPTVRDLLTQVGHKASIILAGEALPLHTFHTRNSAERWGNRLVMRRLVPAGMSFDVRATTLFLVRPKDGP